MRGFVRIVLFGFTVPFVVLFAWVSLRDPDGVIARLYRWAHR